LLFLLPKINEKGKPGLLYIGLYQYAPETSQQPSGAEEWGYDVVEAFLLTNLRGLHLGIIDIDLDRGPRPNAPYIEQHASTPIYSGSFLSKKSRLNIIIKYLCW
jgi:hypothetical protein